jgi:hypothetical protein
MKVKRSKIKTIGTILAATEIAFVIFFCVFVFYKVVN